MKSFGNTKWQALNQLEREWEERNPSIRKTFYEPRGETKLYTCKRCKRGFYSDKRRTLCNVYCNGTQLRAKLKLRGLIKTNA